MSSFRHHHLILLNIQVFEIISRTLLLKFYYSLYYTSAEVSQVAWNTQVSHILASASQNGSCFVWDLRQKKAWCELRDPTGGSISDIAWNPDQGLNLITARLIFYYL